METRQNKIFRSAITITIEGKGFTRDSFIKACKSKNVDPEQSIFIFPGDESHHEGQSLYSQKSGDGELGYLAHLLGGDEFIDPYPTLSLPIRFKKLTSIDDQISLATSAIADLWHALGLGYNIVLPIRKHKNDTFFSKHLITSGQKKESYEPSFWGGIESVPNKKLADYYLEELKKILHFCDPGHGSASVKESILNSNPIFKKAFFDGQNKIFGTDLQKLKYGIGVDCDFSLNKYLPKSRSQLGLGWSLLIGILVGACAVGIAILSGGTAVPLLVGIGGAGFLIGGGTFLAISKTPAPAIKVKPVPAANRYSPGGSTALIPGATANNNVETKQAEVEPESKPAKDKRVTSTSIRGEKLPTISEDGSGALQNNPSGSPKTSKKS